MGLFGPPDIDKLKANKDVPGLIKALGYEKRLGWIGDSRAIGPLTEALLRGIDTTIRG